MIFFSVFFLIKVIKELGKTKDTKATMIKRGENKQDGEKSPREDIKKYIIQQKMFEKKLGYQ